LARRILDRIKFDHRASASSPAYDAKSERPLAISCWSLNGGAQQRGYRLTKGDRVDRMRHSGLCA
jgi:hypothetical protein